MPKPSDFFTSEETFASTLLILMFDRFGDAFLTGENGPWTAETIRLEVKDQFCVDIPDSNLGKLMSAIAVLVTDNFFRSLPSFLFTIHGLLGDGTDWSYAEPMDLEDLAWAMTEALLLSPAQEEDLFDSQIVAYCNTLVKREGLLSPPSVLCFAKEEAAYGEITAYDEDIMMEQADRTNAINEYIEEQTQALLSQIASVPSLNVTTSSLYAALVSELEAIQAKDKWV